MQRTLYDIWESGGYGFERGVNLLVKHAPKALTSKALQTLRLLAASGEAPSDYYLEKMRYALEQSPAPETFDLKPYTEPRPTATQGGFTTSITFTKSAFHPTGAIEIRVPEAKDLHKQHSHYHALMVTAETDQERGEYARTIMEQVIPELDRLYDAARARNAGEPVEEPPAPATTSDFRRLQSLRTRVARLRNQLIPAASGARRAQLEQELTEKLKLIKALSEGI